MIRTLAPHMLAVGLAPVALFVWALLLEIVR